MHFKIKSVLKNCLISICLLLAAYVISFQFHYVFSVHEHVTSVFLLAVFLISLLTKGYGYGVTATFVSMLIINYVFTEPFFAFDFVTPDNLVSAFVMVAIAVLTCTLTTRMKEHQEAKRAFDLERMRSNLLRAVSHDLRTPLTTIYGSSTTLISERHHLSEAQQTAILQGIQKDSEWLVHMVENLLSITRIDNGSVDLTKTSTVLDELIDSVLVKYRKQHPHQEVILELPEELVIIPMDALLIEQVLLNLLANANHHAKGMTHLWLRITVQGEQAVFEVSDDGCGIPPEQLPHMFTSIFDESKSPADGKRHNSGIGLSVCATIIKAHDGTILAENRPEGGARFRFTLAIEGDDYEQ